MDSNIGRIFGAFVVKEMIGLDNSRHKLYRCECTNCGHEIITTMYNLEHGRIKTVCKICDTHNDARPAPPITSFSMNNKTTDVNEPDDVDESENDEVSTSTDEETANVITFTTYTGNNTVDVTVGNGNVIKQSGPEYMEYRVNDELSIFVRNKKRSLFNMPSYYFFAHCIPTDCSCHGAVAKQFDNYYDLETNLSGMEHHVGEVALYGNVFSLFPNSKKHELPTIDSLSASVANLAFECADRGVQFLAMPHIGCGSNHLNWYDVRKMIIDNFIEEYKYAYDIIQNRNAEDNTNDATPNSIYITFCY